MPWPSRPGWGSLAAEGKSPRIPPVRSVVCGPPTIYSVMLRCGKNPSLQGRHEPHPLRAKGTAAAVFRATVLGMTNTTQERRLSPGQPAKQGLYDPQFEHDACGVGFVVDIKGRKSHRILVQAIQVLKNL